MSFKATDSFGWSVFSIINLLPITKMTQIIPLSILVSLAMGAMPCDFASIPIKELRLSPSHLLESGFTCEMDFGQQDMVDATVCHL